MITDIAENILTYMELGDWQALGNNKAMKLTKSSFNNSMPLAGENVEYVVNELVGNLQFWADAKQKDLDKPLDTSFVVSNPDEPENFALSRFTRVSVRDVKANLLRQPRPNIIRHATAHVDRNSGKVQTSVSYYDSTGLSDDVYRELPVAYKRFSGAGHHYQEHIQIVKPNIDDHRASEMIRIACAAQFNREFLWSVSVGWLNTPSVLFLCDTEGAREALKLRDIPEGRKRRSAIIHWVSGHWRKNNVNGSIDELIKVREHLRGSRNESLDGFVIRIEPSLSDLKRIAKSIEDRKDLKRLGLDRIRVPVINNGGRQCR